MLKPKQHLGRSGLIAPDKRMCVRRNPWATAHLGHLELRSTCELTRLAQRGRRATAMARTSPAKQRSTIMAPRGVPQPLGYGSLGSSCDVLSLAPFLRCAVCVIIIIANKYSITTTITNHNGRRPHDAYTIQSHEANNHRHGALITMHPMPQSTRAITHAHAT